MAAFFRARWGLKRWCGEGKKKSPRSGERGLGEFFGLLNLFQARVRRMLAKASMERIRPAVAGSGMGEPVTWKADMLLGVD